MLEAGKLPPNTLLSDARRRIPSPSRSGRWMSRQELADAVNAYLFREHPKLAGIDANYIGKLERGGHRWPSGPRRAAFRAVLNATSDADIGLYIVRSQSGTLPVGNDLPAGSGDPFVRLGFGDRAASTLEPGGGTRAVSWVDRRDFISTVTALTLGVSSAGVPEWFVDLLPAVAGNEPLRRVGLADVEYIEATTRAFRELDNLWGGGSSRAAVLAQLQWVSATSKTALCVSETVRARLLSAVADLANVAAFMSYDIERQGDARRLWLLGLDACREANNVGLTGSTLRQLCHQALHLNRADEALRLIRLVHATMADPDFDATELALAETAAYEGWSYAAAGKVQACHRSLGHAEEHFANTASEEIPPWLEHFDRAELTGLRGHAFHVLADHAPSAALGSQPLLREAIDARGPQYPRGRTLNLIALSATYFQLGQDIDEGVAIGHQALDGIATLTSPRALARLGSLLSTTAAYADIDDVDAFREQLGLALSHAA